MAARSIDNKMLCAALFYAVFCACGAGLWEAEIGVYPKKIENISFAQLSAVRYNMHADKKTNAKSKQERRAAMVIDGYTPLEPRLDVSIQDIFSVHYFEYASDYAYAGEQHNFWEFCYVDKGELEYEVDGRAFTLKNPQVVFHKPGEHHCLRANGRVAPNLVVASFSCPSPLMHWFEDKVLEIGADERALLAHMLDEASSAFLSPLDDPDLKQLERSAGAKPGAEQLVKTYLELFLLTLYRKGQGSGAESRPDVLRQEKANRHIIDSVVTYLEKNIGLRLKLEDICRDNLVGRSQLQKVFREWTGGGVMDYFGRLKIEAAKRMIREGQRNFTEIAAGLGYTSIHYFSRHFKKVAGMTPSEYASSVKVLTGRDRLL